MNIFYKIQASLVILLLLLNPAVGQEPTSTEDDSILHPEVIAPEIEVESMQSGCVIMVSPSSHNVEYYGATVISGVGLTGSCSYSTYTNSPWITVTKLSDGSALQIVVAANSGATRTGYIDVDGSQTITITQSCPPVGQPGTISGNANVCSGAQSTYSISAVSGASGYQWSVSGGSIVSGQNTISAVVTFNAGTSATVSVASKSSCGTLSNNTNKSITINTTLGQPGVISGTTPVCEGSTYAYSISPVSGATSYTWTIPSGAGGSSTTTGINVTFGSSSGNITVKANNAAGCSSTASTKAISVSTAPYKYTVTGSGAVCQGGSLPVGLNGSTSGLQYKLYLNGSFLTPPLTGNGVSLSFGNQSQGGTYTVKVVTAAGCEVSMNGSAVITLRPLSTAPTSINATASTICPGSSTTLTVSGGSLGEVASWKWYSGGCGTTAVGTGSSITVSPGSTTVYYVRAEGTCNTTACASKTITVTAPPAITQHPANLTICDGAPASFSVSATAGSTFQWQQYVSGSWSNIAGATSSTYNITSTTGMEGRSFRCVVTGGSPCYLPSTSNSATISFKTLYQYTVSLSDPGLLCPGETREVQLNGSTEGIQYKCYLNGSFQEPPETGDGGPITFGQKSYAGTYTVKGVKDGCEILMKDSAVIAFKPASTAASSISATPSVIPPGGSTTLNVVDGSLVENASWQWYSEGCGTTPVGTGESITLTPESTTTYYVRAEGGSCGNTSCETRTVIINQYPVVDAGFDQSIELPLNQVTLNAAGNDPDGMVESYSWSLISGPEVTLSDHGNGSVTISGLIEATYLFRVTIRDNYNFLSTDDVMVTVYAAGVRNHNYIKETVALEPGKTETAHLAGLTVEEKNVTITFFDGLGRPMQTASWQSSPEKRDIIQPFYYDKFGRETRKYLPYVAEGSDGRYREIELDPDLYETSDHYKFYQSSTNPSPSVVKDRSPFSTIVFEPSPLNRALEQGATGLVWQPTDETGSSDGHTVKTVYLTNTSGDVLLMIVDESGSLVFPTTGGQVIDGKYFYNANQLYKIVSKDENWRETGDPRLHTTEEYKDKQGKVILKRSFVKNEEGNTVAVETYYVYDDFGLLRYVIPPKAGSILTLPAGKNNPVIKSLCYYYQYDERNRMIVKQLPGAEPVFMVYDDRDRIVATQDGRLRADNFQWLFTKYDVLNRPILTGLYQPAAICSTQTTMKEHVEQFYMSPDKELFEERGDVVLNYTNRSFPDVPFQEHYLTAIYYDNYTPDKHEFSTLYNISEYSDNEGSNNNYFESLRDKVTETHTRVLGSSTWLLTTMYYDDRYRLIQTISDNYTGGKDHSSSNYDFVGKVTKTLQVHMKTGSTENFRIVKDYEYDHMKRLEKIYHQVNNQPRVLMSRLKYNELGQLIEKNLHSSDEGINFTQSVDYRYNIRGWLQSINNADIINDGLTNDDSNDKFGMELYYEQEQ